MTNKELRANALNRLIEEGQMTKKEIDIIKKEMAMAKKCLTQTDLQAILYKRANLLELISRSGEGVWAFDNWFVGYATALGFVLTQGAGLNLKDLIAIIEKSYNTLYELDESDDDTLFSSFFSLQIDGYVRGLKVIAYRLSVMNNMTYHMYERETFFWNMYPLLGFYGDRAKELSAFCEKGFALHERTVKEEAESFFLKS